MPQVFKRADTGRKQEEYQLVGSFDHEPSEWRAACGASMLLTEITCKTLPSDQK